MPAQKPKCKQCGREIDPARLKLLVGDDLCEGCHAPSTIISTETCLKCGVSLTTSNALVSMNTAAKFCNTCAAKLSSLGVTADPTFRIAGDPSARLIGDESTLRIAGDPNARLIGDESSFRVAGDPNALLIGDESIFRISGDPSLGLSVSNISESLSGLIHGTLSPQVTPIIEPREERVAFLEERVRELQEAASESEDLRKALQQMRRELKTLKKEMKAEEGTKRESLDFNGLCRILQVWIPRRPRKYEEAYKSELAEHLSKFSTNVEEEPQDGITDVLVEGTLPELCGKLKRVVAAFDIAAVVILRVSSLDRYNAFLKIIEDMRDVVRVFPKA